MDCNGPGKFWPGERGSHCRNVRKSRQTPIFGAWRAPWASVSSALKWSTEVIFAAHRRRPRARPQRGQLPRRQEARRSSWSPTAWAATPRARSRARSRCAPSTRRSRSERELLEDFVAGARGARARHATSDILAAARARRAARLRAHPRGGRRPTPASAAWARRSSRSSSPAAAASSPTSATAASTCCATAASSRSPRTTPSSTSSIKRGKLTREQIEKVGAEERDHPRRRRLRARRGRHADARGPPRRPVPPRVATGSTATSSTPTSSSRYFATRTATRRRKGSSSSPTRRAARTTSPPSSSASARRRQSDDERAKRSRSSARCSRKMPLFARLSERELLRVMQVVEVARLRATSRSSSSEGDKRRRALHRALRHGDDLARRADPRARSAPASTSARWR